MHPFQFKIKGYLNETGEYTEYFPADAGTILQFIIQHWFNESLPNNLDAIVIQNQRGDMLIIDHLKRDIFDYYYVSVNVKKEYFHSKTDIQLMFFLLEGFFNNREEDLTNNLKRKDDEADLVFGDLSGKKFTYKINQQSLWKNLNWLIYQALAMAAFLIFGLFVHVAVVAIVLVFAGLAFGANYSKIKMYRQYYNDNRDLEVTVSRGNDQLTVKKGEWSRVIPKTEIRKITRFMPPMDDVQAQAEYYLEIEFLNGDVLNLTSLLIGQTDADGKFMHNLIPFEAQTAKNGLLKRPTSLQHYFSAIGIR
jgi:hypothetical protein